MKLILTILGVFFGFCYTAAKQTTIVKFGAVNQYLSYGGGDVLDKDPAMQTLLLVLYSNGFNWSIWNHNDFKGWNKSLGSEVDYGLGWEGTVGAYIDLEVSLTYFDEPKVFTLGAGDIVYGQAKLSRNILNFTAEIQFERYVTMPNSGFTGGNLYSIGARKKLLAGEQVSISNSLALVYDDGGFGLDEGYLMRGILTVDWKVSKRLTITAPQIYYYAPLTVRDSRKNNAMIYCGIGYAL